MANTSIINNMLTLVADSMDNNLTDVVSYHDIVSDGALLIVQWLVHAVVCQAIDVFGTITNIINIICFVEQGFQESVNISLLGLAISDLGCLLSLVWTNICSIPAVSELDLQFEPLDVQYLTGAWPHVIFARVTSWITVFITLERCMCVTMPLKIKTIFTHKRVSVIIVCIFCVLIASVSPVFNVNRLATKFSFKRNKTIFGLVFTHDRDSVEAINFIINSVFVQFSAFITLIVCTVILVVNLRSKTKWRQKSLAPGQFDGFSTRDLKVAKMVITLSSLFIFCYAPALFIIIVMIVKPGFSIGGKYNNLFIVVSSISFTFESVNSAVNIFIYYKMSSKYRATLTRKLIRKTKKKRNKVK